MNMMDDDQDQDNPFVLYPNDNAFNKRVFSIYMISFSLLLFFLISLYLYVRCVLAHRSRHRDTVRRLTFVALQARDAHNPHFFTEPLTTGLDPALVASLPIFTVREKVSDGENGSDASKAECVVCLTALEGEEKAKLLPNCNHFFHVDCIETWLGSHSTCPLCRAEVKPRLKPQNREGPVFSTSINLCALDNTPALLLGGVDGGGETSKSNGSNSSLSSFRRILSRERSFKRIQPSGHDYQDSNDADHDLERQ